MRHLMHAGRILLLIDMLLWPESYVGALLALVPIGTSVLRARLEERFLRRELNDHEVYTRRVRYRLAPFFR